MSQYNIAEAKAQLSEPTRRALAGEGMRLLLDTHAFLWWLDDDTQRSPEVRGCEKIPVGRVSAA